MGLGTVRFCVAKSDAVSIHLTVIASTALNIHRIHHISMTNEQIRMGKSFNSRYEPNVALLPLFPI